MDKYWFGCYQGFKHGPLWGVWQEMINVICSQVQWYLDQFIQMPLQNVHLHTYQPTNTTDPVQNYFEQVGKIIIHE